MGVRVHHYKKIGLVVFHARLIGYDFSVQMRQPQGRLCEKKALVIHVGNGFGYRFDDNAKNFLFSAQRVVLPQVAFILEYTNAANIDRF